MDHNSDINVGEEEVGILNEEEGWWFWQWKLPSVRSRKPPPHADLQINRWITNIFFSVISPPNGYVFEQMIICLQMLCKILFGINIACNFNKPFIAINVTIKPLRSRIQNMLKKQQHRK